MKYHRFFLVIVSLFIVSIVRSGEIICVLKGTIVDRNSKTLLLVKATESPASGISVPVINNRFEYTLKAVDMEVYRLIFKDEYDNGAYNPISFFPDNAEITFILYPQNQSDKNSIAGGLLNKAWFAFNKERKAQFASREEVLNAKAAELRKNHDYNSIAFDSLWAIWRAAKTQDEKIILYRKRDEMEAAGLHLTANGKKLNDERTVLTEERRKWQYDYIRNHPTLVSYYLLHSDASMAKDEPGIAGNIKEIFPYYAVLFPEHPYTEGIANTLRAINMLRSGEKFIDFAAPDLTGKMYQFAELQKGKITLLDLWGSWCGPCIAVSRTMIPVFNEFRDKGFQVIGVAREFKGTSALKAALKREKYPWINLLELDDKQKIWNKYSVDNRGGGVFLFDKDGSTLAVNPTAEAVREILKKKLL